MTNTHDTPEITVSKQSESVSSEESITGYYADEGSPVKRSTTPLTGIPKPNFSFLEASSANSFSKASPIKSTSEETSEEIKANITPNTSPIKNNFAEEDSAQRIHYFFEAEKRFCKIYWAKQIGQENNDGLTKKWLYEHEKKPVDSSLHLFYAATVEGLNSSWNWEIFINNKILNHPSLGTIHHSTLGESNKDDPEKESAQNRKSRAAGHLEFDNNSFINRVTNDSGHYTPTPRKMFHFLHYIFVNQGSIDHQITFTASYFDPNTTEKIPENVRKHSILLTRKHFYDDKNQLRSPNEFEALIIEQSNADNKIDIPKIQRRFGARMRVHSQTSSTDTTTESNSAHSSESTHHHLPVTPLAFDSPTNRRKNSSSEEDEASSTTSLSLHHFPTLASFSSFPINQTKQADETRHASDDELSLSSSGSLNADEGEKKPSKLSFFSTESNQNDSDSTKQKLGFSCKK